MNSIERRHVALEGLESRDGYLYVAQQPITEIAERADGKPFFVYSKSAIKDRLASIRQAVPVEVSIHYAVKANPFSPLLQFVADHVDGLDVASVGELELAIESGASPETIGFAGPGKTTDELEASVRAGITLQVESITELDRITAIARQLELTPNIALRINPDFELRGSGMKMSGSATPFGIDAELAPDVLNHLRSLPVKFTGFHIYTGSQCLDAEAICKSQRQCVALARQLATHAPTPPETVNIGGGFGIPYFPGEKSLDINKIGHNLQRLVEDMRGNSFHARLVLELGRYIVGESGIYVCRVVDRKISRGKTFLVTDGGMHHHLAASGNLGQVLRRNYPVVIANKIGAKATEIATVVGRLCTPLDVLARDAELARADVGDYIAIFQSGAYGLTSSPTAFLSHPEPAQLLV